MNKFFTSTIIGVLLLGIGVPALAEYAPKKADLTCMRTAVGAREDAIVAAKEKSFASLDSAFKARRDALKSAWDKPVAHDRRSAINAAWKAFRESHKVARAQLRTDDKAAWSTFKTNSKACHVDTSSVGSDKAGEKIDRDTL
ncbi:MAG TPA: hypothetical protein VJI96_03655 [Candidatus Andersenbacteria bacterium]|nr:hypothetical protein [Candidatus Andersenbacteria bacterium]